MANDCPDTSTPLIRDCHEGENDVCECVWNDWIYSGCYTYDYSPEACVNGITPGYDYSYR